MKILVLTQVYWPDTVATAQHLADICTDLSKSGHQVTVWTSRFAYEDTSEKYPAKESHQGVQVVRLRNTGFGKATVFGRLSDFFTFNLLILLKLLFVGRRQYDMILGMTSPPLVSWMGCLAARWKNIRFCYWTMDLQPELAIQSGMIKEGSLIARCLTLMGTMIFKHADRIVALDRFMAQHCIQSGADPESTVVVPVWPVMSQRYTGTRDENPFRISQDLGDRFVIMYSGNHSYVHPLDTLLKSAFELRDRDDILFVFIGGGVRKRDVADFRQNHRLRNIIQLPYQPRDQIHFSLGSADLQVVIMGEGQVGYTHPNKVYGAMFLAKPILYIGPSPSHITEILDHCPGNISVEHGESKQLTQAIIDFKKLGQEKIDEISMANWEYAQQHFHPDALRASMKREIEQTASAK